MVRNMGQRDTQKGASRHRPAIMHVLNRMPAQGVQMEQTGLAKLVTARDREGDAGVVHLRHGAAGRRISPPSRLQLRHLSQGVRAAVAGQARKRRTGPVSTIRPTRMRWMRSTQRRAVPGSGSQEAPSCRACRAGARQVAAVHLHDIVQIRGGLVASGTEHAPPVGKRCDTPSTENAASGIFEVRRICHAQRL